PGGEPYRLAVSDVHSPATSSHAPSHTTQLTLCSRDVAYRTQAKLLILCPARGLRLRPLAPCWSFGGPSSALTPPWLACAILVSNLSGLSPTPPAQLCDGARTGSCSRRLTPQGRRWSSPCPSCSSRPTTHRSSTAPRWRSAGHRKAGRYSGGAWPAPC